MAGESDGRAGPGAGVGLEGLRGPGPERRRTLAAPSLRRPRLGRGRPSVRSGSGLGANVGRRAEA